METLRTWPITRTVGKAEFPSINTFWAGLFDPTRAIVPRLAEEFCTVGSIFWVIVFLKFCV